MPQLEFSELPEDLRVQLTESGREELWHRVDEFGGVKAVSDPFDFSQSRMYNWKNKDLALPVGFVQRLMGEKSCSEVILLKGESSSGGISDPEFPLKVSEEILTRITSSVVLNSEQTPTYITSERVLADRFVELLERFGKVEHTVYSRLSRFEVRYPKFLNELLSDLEFEQNVPARIDEQGTISDEKIILEDREIPVKDFKGELYSIGKRFELALQRGNSGKIAELMAEESSKVRSMLRK